MGVGRGKGPRKRAGPTDACGAPFLPAKKTRCLRHRLGGPLHAIAWVAWVSWVALCFGVSSASLFLCQPKNNPRGTPPAYPAIREPRYTANPGSIAPHANAAARPSIDRRRWGCCECAQPHRPVVIPNPSCHITAGLVSRCCCLVYTRV